MRLARRVLRQGGAASLALGGSFALALLEALPALAALVLGFTLPAALAGVLAAGAAGLLAGVRSPAIGQGRTGAAFWLCVVPLWAFSVYLLHTHTLLEQGGAYFCGQSTFGDLPMHLAFIRSIAGRGSWPPVYPLLAGQPVFGYPFLCESVSSVFLLLGADLKTACLLPQAAALLAVFGMGWLFARRVLGSDGNASLAYTLFFLGSGFGFVYFLGGEKGNFSRIFTEFYQTPTNYTVENIRWVNPIADLLIPQRATLFGWALLFACLYLLYRFAFEGETRLWPALALLAGCLPLTHTHSLLALVLLSAVYLVRAVLHCRGRWNALLPWVWYALLAGALCLPQLFGIIFRQTSGGENFLRWQFNWANEGDPYLWFYIKNIGIVYLLLIPAFLHADKALRWLYSGGLLILLLAEFVVFQPNPYDNNKLLFIWHLLGCVLAADLIGSLTARLWAKRRAAAVLGCGALVFLGTFGSVLTLGREAVSRYQMFSPQAAAAADFLRENTPPDALFLTGTSHLNPTASLAGRPILCGSSIYVYFHGTRYQAQENAVTALYEAPAEELLRQWGIRYAVIGPEERSSFAVDEAFYQTRFPILYEDGGYTVFQTGM